MGVGCGGCKELPAGFVHSIDTATSLSPHIWLVECAHRCRLSRGRPSLRYHGSAHRDPLVEPTLLG
jgi:hypothetical protein